MNNGNRPLILYAEDNATNYRLMSRILGRMGIDIVRGRSATEALQVAKEYKGNLLAVFLDVELPDCDINIFKDVLVVPLRDIVGDNVPIIALTAHVLHGVEEQVLASGCDDYISKPMEVNVIHEQIQRLRRHTHGY